MSLLIPIQLAEGSISAFDACRVSDVCDVALPARAPPHDDVSTAKSAWGDVPPAGLPPGCHVPRAPHGHHASPLRRSQRPMTEGKTLANPLLTGGVVTRAV